MASLVNPSSKVWGIEVLKPFLSVADPDAEKAVACTINILRSQMMPLAGNTKGVSITVPLTSCLTGLESAV